MTPEPQRGAGTGEVETIAMTQARRKPTSGRCPTEAEIELFVLTDSPSVPRSDALAQHVRTCPRCGAVERELGRFYDLLLSSLSAPVSACVLDYVFHRTLEVKEVAHFALRPLPEQEGQGRAFLCEQVGRIPGEALEEAVKDFAAHVLAGGEAGLYALQLTAAPRVLLFLWVPDNGRQSATLSFPALGKSASLSRYGMAVVEGVEIPALNGQHLTLLSSRHRSPGRRTRIDMISSAL